MKTIRCTVSAICLVALFLGTCAAHAQNVAAHYRTLPPPKILYLAQSSTYELMAETLRAKIPAQVTFATLSYNDQDFHHLCDKPLEESKDDIAVVTREGKAYLDAILADLKKYDVIVTQFPGSSADPELSKTILDAETHIAQRVREGGKLIILDFPQSGFASTPYADIMPCKATANATWTTGSGTATDHPFSRGLPFEITGSHDWGPLYEPIDASSIPLTNNTANRNRFWLRSLPGGGQTVYLYSLYGGAWFWSSGSNYKTYLADRPDDAAVWDAFLPRLFYGLTYGDRAFPMLAKIALPEKSTARLGEKLTIPVDVENRSGEDRRGKIAIEISDRRTPGKITDSREISLKKGERQTISFDATIDLPCADNNLLIRARVLDETAKLCLSESMAWVPYTHQVALTVETNKPSYKPAEPIKVIVKPAPDALPAGAALRIFLVDHDGRAMQSSDGVKDLVMPDGGPEFVSSYWVTVQVVLKDRLIATARTQVQLDRPWSMRNQVQWSVWSTAGDPRTLALFRDAGFNSLGYPGNNAAADRFGMRQYVEGTDINTFGVTIDNDNWKDVRTAMEQRTDVAEKAFGTDARSKALVSLGEESGFKNGWGQRYYWEEDKAPAIPQKVFDEYLSERYANDISLLNVEWGTDYKSFAQIPLERAKARAPEQVFVNSQAWEAAQKQGKTQDTFPVDVKAVNPKTKYLASTAPYFETYAFFDWYYQKYCDLAMETYRARRNPVPLSIMSAPSFYPKVDVYNFGFVAAFYPKEASLVGNASARRDYGDVPGFGLMWAYFDLHSLWSCNVLSNVLVGNAHMDYWVDFPLTFNSDLTHTRASFWNKAFTRQLHPIEPILLHRKFEYTKGLGMFIPPQPMPKGILGAHFGSAISPSAPIYSALEESGYMPKVVAAAEFNSVSVLVAPYAEVVSPAEGKALSDFVKNGGLLIATPWLASCSSHGNLLSVYPAPETGLADLLGFKLLNTSQNVAPQDVEFEKLKLTSKGADKVLDLSSDVEVLAKYADGTPLILRRAVGRGHVIYLNFVYDWNGWWNSFYEPARESYRQLIDGFIRTDNRATPEYKINFESAEAVPDNNGWWGTVMAAQPKPGEAIAWWASQLFADPTGRIKYLAIMTDHRSPKITANVEWVQNDVEIFDLFKGAKVPSEGGHAKLTLRPGEATLWAITSRAPKAVTLQTADHVTAGKPIQITIASADAAGATLDVYDPSGKMSRNHSIANVQFTDGKATLEIPTAANDAPGEYRLVATESMTRLHAEARVKIDAGESLDAKQLTREILTPFPRRASEEWPQSEMTSAQFIDELRALEAVYQGSYKGLDAKYMLSYFLDVPFRPNNRHAILRRLQRVDWKPHLQAVVDAIRSGEHFCLTGEDLNVDPETGLSIDPFAVGDPSAFLESLANVPGAKRATRTADGFTFESIEIGKGSMIVSRAASIDRAVYRSVDFLAWHERFKQALSKHE